MSLKSAWRSLKKSHRSIISVSILTAIAFGAAAGFGVATEKPFTVGGALAVGAQIPPGCGGFDTLAVSSVPVVSNDAVLSNLNYVITSIMGGAQCYTGGLTASSLATNAGTPSKELTFLANNVKEKVSYNLEAAPGVTVSRVLYWPVDEGNNLLVALSGDNAGTAGDGVVWVKEGYPLPLCAVSASGVKPSYEIILSYAQGWNGKWWTLYCVAEFPVATPGNIRGPGLGTNADVTICAGTECLSRNVGAEPGTIGQEFSLSAGIGTVAVVKPQTVGLNPNQPLPDTGGYSALYIKGQSQWHVVSTLALNSYTGSYASLIGNLRDNNVMSKGSSVNFLGAGFIDTLRQSISDWNGVEARDDSATLVPGFTKTVAPTASTGGPLTYEGRPTYSRTTYTITARADWVGVVIPVGQPDLVSVSPAEFTSGGAGQIGLVARNAGNVLASFNFLAACQSPVYQSKALSNIPLGPGQQASLALDVSGGAAATAASGTCKVTMCDSQRASLCVSKDTTYSMSAPSECVGIAEGRSRSSGSAIYSCINNKLVSTSCPLGVAPDGSRCLTTQDRLETIGGEATQPTPPPAGQIPGAPPSGFYKQCDLGCKLGKLPTIVWAIIMLAVGGIGYAVWKKRRGY